MNGFCMVCIPYEEGRVSNNKLLVADVIMNMSSIQSVMSVWKKNILNVPIFFIRFIMLD